MIKSIYTSSPFLTISGGAPISTYIGHNTGTGVGNMRYNPNNQLTEVFDGSSWIVMASSTASIGLDNEAVSLLEWARKKRNEELELERLVEINPAIKDLVNQVKEKQEQIKMVMTLIKSPGNGPQELMGS